jgi:hypothetical protein
MTIPLGVVAGFVPLALFAYDGYKTGGGIVNAGGRIAQRLTGYDSSINQFVPAELAKGWTPILLGVGAHYLAGKLGINRALGRVGVPLLRI